MRRQRAVRHQRIGASCRGRGSKTRDGVALRVRLQPLLQVRGANLAVRLAPPSQVVEGLEQVVYRGRDRQLEFQVGGARRRWPHPRLCCLGVVLRAELEQEGVVFALSQRLDDHASAVRQADYSLRPQQALRVADGDVRICRAEHADYPLWVLLSPLGHREGGCRVNVRDGPRMEVRNVRGPDDVSLPCGPWMLLLVGAIDQCGGVGPPRLLPFVGGADGV